MSWFSDFLQGGSQTKTVDPWKPAVAGLKTSLGTAQNIYNSRPDLYSGRFTAQNNPLQSEGLGWQELLARNMNATNPGAGTINLANKMTSDAANYHVPTFGEYDTSAIQPVIKALTDPVFQRYSTDIAPQMLAGQDRSGATHNSRAIIDNYNTADAFGREAGNIAATTGYQDFNDWRSLLNNNYQFNASTAPSIFTSGYAQQLLPSSLLQQTGQGYQGLEQNDINNALQTDQYNRNTPWQDFMNLFNVQSTAGQLGSTTTVQDNSNPLTQLMKLLSPVGAQIFGGSGGADGGGGGLGSLMSALGIGNAGMAAGAASVGATGAGAASAMGPLLAMASSRTFKENISELSGKEALEKIAAVPAYKYNYKGSSEEYFGPMAEDFNGTKLIPMPQMLGLCYAVLRELALRELARGNA